MTIFNVMMWPQLKHTALFRMSASHNIYLNIFIYYTYILLAARGVLLITFCCCLCAVRGTHFFCRWADVVQIMRAWTVRDVRAMPFNDIKVEDTQHISTHTHNDTEIYQQRQHTHTHTSRWQTPKHSISRMYTQHTCIRFVALTALAHRTDI